MKVSEEQLLPSELRALNMTVEPLCKDPVELQVLTEAGEERRRARLKHVHASVGFILVTSVDL